MNYQQTAVKGAVQGVAIVAIMYAAKKINKNWSTPSSGKFLLFVVTATALSSLGMDYAEEKGYLKLGS